MKKEKKEHQKESMDERERKSEREREGREKEVRRKEGRERGKKGSLALQNEVCLGFCFLFFSTHSQHLNSQSHLNI